MRRAEYLHVIDEAEASGCRVRATRRSHWQLLLPDGRTVIHTGSTPQDHRSARNLAAELRRHGVEVRQ